jgi:hypothetical protein
MGRPVWSTSQWPPYAIVSGESIGRIVRNTTKSMSGSPDAHPIGHDDAALVATRNRADAQRAVDAVHREQLRDEADRIVSGITRSFLSSRRLSSVITSDHEHCRCLPYSLSATVSPSEKHDLPRSASTCDMSSTPRRPSISR